MLVRSRVWNHTTDLARAIRQHEMKIARPNAARQIREQSGIGHVVLGREETPRDTADAFDDRHAAGGKPRSRRTERSREQNAVLNIEQMSGLDIARRASTVDDGRARVRSE